MAEKRSEWFDWIKAFGIAAILAIIIRLFLFSPVIVDGPSMQPNLQNGDFLIVNKISYILGEPDRFDVVVFHATESRDYIKRVIGLPGEHVKYENETLYINDKPVKEPFLEERVESFTGTYTHNFTLENLPGNFEKIPDGHVLVLGDNRTNSKDSRRLGLIPVDELVGKAQLIAWPLDRFGFVGK
ncbi:signal peptidase I [Pontibacillus sp. HMF3514]|uniref:signal peptidase I n=1 Tax=Pontibacillus sp. HMF3514 TaxID=2692425 RepID=UPI0013202DB6|nr:signal peptidase I [Pontibacillus sp. HMF3514]QHE52172.1 signal peptidase I [Pontibacillus sp. HMF3514]